MRRFVQAIALGAVFLLPARSSAQDTSDTALRAAYCVGVLQESIRRIRADLPLWSSDQGTYAEADLASLEAYEAKLQRYAQYLLIRGVGSTAPQIEAIKMVIAKGQRETAEKQRSIGRDHVIWAECRNSGSAFPDCAAKYDQVYANIVRCQFAPDRLPF